MSPSFDTFTIVLPALAMEQSIGAPPAEAHPIQLVTAALNGLIERHADVEESTAVVPLTVTIAGGALLFTVLKVVVTLGRKLPLGLGTSLESALLYLILGPARLTELAENIRTVLEQRNIESARELLRAQLLDRDVNQMDSSQIAEATMELVATKTVSDVTAPLFYYAVGGVPAALAYYYVNQSARTAADAGDEAAAQLQDWLNYIPARITAFLMMVAAEIRHAIRSRHNFNEYIQQTQQLDPQHTPFLAALHTWRHDQDLTSDLNSGQMLSALAGGTGIKLGIMGADGRAPQSEDIRAAVRIMQLTVGLFLALYAFLRLFGRSRKKE